MGGVGHCAVLVRPLVGVVGAVVVRRSSFFALAATLTPPASDFFEPLSAPVSLSPLGAMRHLLRTARPRSPNSQESIR